MIPTPPPPPPPPPPSSNNQNQSKSQNSNKSPEKTNKIHPLLTGNTSTEVDSSIIDGLKEFSKPSTKERRRNNLKSQDKTQSHVSVSGLGKSGIKVAVDAVHREKTRQDSVPRHLTSQLINLSRSNISSTELKQSCSNIVTLASHADDVRVKSEKDVLLQRLEQLFQTEEKQLRSTLEIKHEELRKLKLRHFDVISDVELRHAEELFVINETQQRELKMLKQKYNEESENLKQKLRLLQEKQSQIRPVELVSPAIVSRPLSSASSASTVIDDISDEIQCCQCHFICFPPAKIFQCSEGNKFFYCFEGNSGIT